MSVERAIKVNTLQHWMSRAQSIGKWVLLFVCIAGVSLLLMMFAGVFHAKVENKAIRRLNPIPPNAQFAVVTEVTQPRFESAIGAIKPVHEANVASKILAHPGGRRYRRQAGDGGRCAGQVEQ